MKIVAIGGGTGLSILLRGLKKVTNDITAIVSVADDGGGSGILRKDLGMLPPGDIRSCILALANREPILMELMNYRFTEGNLKGQNFGNLLIAAMNGISSNFGEAIKKVNDILAVTGKVIPVSTDDITLFGELENGEVIKGESMIPFESLKASSAIKRVFIEPEDAKCFQEAIDAIMEADIIVMGPGSLYTSIIPNLLIKEIRNAILESRAMKAYVVNLMTQPGETDKYGVADHVHAIESYLGKGVIDHVLVNSSSINGETMLKYNRQKAYILEPDKSEIDELNALGYNVALDDFLEEKEHYIRHDALKIAEKLKILCGERCNE
jgi:uncharacterized cofD-like protein